MHLIILTSHFHLLCESQTLKVHNTIILTTLFITVYLMATSVGLWIETFSLGKNRDILKHFLPLCF